MKNIISSTFYPSQPEFLECRINGRKTNIDFDATKIKCPICSDTMVLSSLQNDGENHEEEEEESVLVYESRRGCVSNVRRIITIQIGVTCPNCDATLNVSVSEIYHVGRKLDNYKVD